MNRGRRNIFVIPDNNSTVYNSLYYQLGLIKIEINNVSDKYFIEYQHILILPYSKPRIKTCDFVRYYAFHIIQSSQIAHDGAISEKQGLQNVLIPKYTFFQHHVTICQCKVQLTHPLHILTLCHVSPYTQQNT